jgi:hypothetical protein
LFIGDGAQGGDGQSLGFAPGKQSGTMSAAQQAHFTGNRADISIAAVVDTALLINHHIPDQRLFQVKEET